MCVSRGLSASGLEAATSGRAEQDPLTQEHLGIVSFFDGIGGLRQALDLLGCAPAAYACSETDAAAWRVVDAQWPGTLHLGTVEEIDETEVWRRLSFEFPRVFVWLAGGGFPCQDLSGLNVMRLGMAGSPSSLLTEMLRVLNGSKASSSAV